MKLTFKICFLILFCAALYWVLHVARRIESRSTGTSSPPPELVPFRTAGGTLHTNGFIKTESITNQTDSWRGMTSASIRFNAIYRYDLKLLGKDWNILIDDTRRVVFVVARSSVRSYPSQSIPAPSVNGLDYCQPRDALWH